MTKQDATTAKNKVEGAMDKHKSERDAGTGSSSRTNPSTSSGANTK